jgi:two-component system, cell cycle response regulator CpdR
MSQAQSKSPLRVLYIEDNALVREITYELLAIDDRDVVAVATGEEALAAFQKSHFDIVVTDISLPAMSGFDLVRHVKKLAPAVPIILASGYPLQLDDAQLGSNIRAITKPFDSPQLEALIQDLCGPQASAAALLRAPQR